MRFPCVAGEMANGISTTRLVTALAQAEMLAFFGLRNPRFEPVLPGQPVTWKYRGQVVPANERITIEMEITARGADDRGRYAIGTGWLWVDGLRIYQVRGLGMRVVPG